MKIAVPREIQKNETRVALVPKLVALLKKDGHSVLVETKAGEGSLFSDSDYVQAGASIVSDAENLYQQADVIFKVQPPQSSLERQVNEAAQVKAGTIYIGFLAPFSNLKVIETFANNRITSYALELLPRSTRAQDMDALTSMATVAGYKAVLLAANYSPKMFPLLMTAAGTITPIKVLVLGAGVAGLQAIATAKRLGAVVEAFDPRPVVKEQVQSLGANFLEMSLPPSQNYETTGGYAKEQSIEFLNQERETIAAVLPKVGVVITTAQIFGKAAPVLLTAEMVKLLPRGAVIVDLAAEQGGNCELTKADEVRIFQDVTIVGTLNLPSTLPIDSSQLYARNVVNLFRYLYPPSAKQATLAPQDEIRRATCVTENGAIVNQAVREKLEASLQMR